MTRAWSCPACAIRRRLGLPPLTEERTLGFEVIEWMESFLVHGPGDVQGDPFRLDDEFAHIVLHLYELDPHGRRIVRRGYLSRPKGRAKTELAAAVMDAELAGPVRFDGWDAKGRPVGRPVLAPQCVAYATEEGQAGTTYSTGAYMLAEGAAADAYDLDVGLSRTYLRGAGVMMAETSGWSSAEGGRTTFACFDETWLWTTGALRELHATVRRNLGKRGAKAEPWSLETSSMFRVGEESVAEQLHRHVTRLGEEGVHDPTLFVDHREAPPVADLSDDEALEAGLRHVYGEAAGWMDLERVMAEIRDPQADPAEARRCWLNQPHRAADAWLPDLTLYTRLAEESPSIEDGEVITLGFDGSLADDATALVACRCGYDLMPRLELLGCWEPPLDAGVNERAAWVVDKEAVLAVVDEAFNRYVVALMYGDPAYWQPELAAWAAEYGGAVVREYPTNRDGRIAPATREYHTAVTTGALRHDGSATLARHHRNARVRPTRHGLVLRKETPRSPLKIDAAMASILAFSARTDAVASRLDRAARRRGHRTLYAF
jgi:hypothetical protein